MIYKKYAHWDKKDFEEMTHHKNSPWFASYVEGKKYTKIDTDSIKEYFKKMLPLELPSNISRDADFVDIDGDGDLDIFVSNSANQRGRARSNMILLNNGAGSFTDASDRLPEANSTLGTGNWNSHNAHVVDINKDACPDIL